MISRVESKIGKRRGRFLYTHYISRRLNEMNSGLKNSVSNLFRVIPGRHIHFCNILMKKPPSKLCVSPSQTFALLRQKIMGRHRALKSLCRHTSCKQYSGQVKRTGNIILFSAQKTYLCHSSLDGSADSSFIITNGGDLFIAMDCACYSEVWMFTWHTGDGVMWHYIRKENYLSNFGPIILVGRFPWAFLLVS